jgi:hypothetical protein
MANNLFQIKRSNTSSTPSTTLNGGELAFSYASNALFIGAQTGIGSVATRIAGSKYSYLDNVGSGGTLANNAALTTDNNQFISNVFTSGLFISGSIAGPLGNSTSAFITSISPQANSTQLGATTNGSNTELATTAAIVTYVSGRTATIFSNGTAYTWSAIQTFNANANFNAAITLGGNTTSLLYSGNSTVFTTVNATSFSGTSNNALYLGGTLASGYQTTAGLAANVLLLAANSASYLGGVISTGYQLTSGLAANVATLTSNNSVNLNGQAASYYLNAGNLTGVLPWASAPTGTVNTSGSFTYTGLSTFNANVTIGTGSQITLGNSTVNTVINATSFSGTANNALNLSGVTLATIQSQITGNAATAYTNAINQVAASGYQTNAGLAANVITLTSNNSNYLGGAPASAYVNTTGSFTLGGIITFNGNVNTNNIITNSITIGSGVSNNNINSTAFYNYSNSTVLTYSNTGWFVAQDGSGSSYINTTAIATTSGSVRIGNTTTNTVITSTSISVVNTSAYNISNSTGAFISTTIGGVANNTVASISNSTGDFISSVNINATSNATSTSLASTPTSITLSSNVLIGNVSTQANTYTANTSSLTVGNTSVNASLSTSGVIAPVGTFSTSISVGSQFTVNTTAVNFGTLPITTSANVTTGNLLVSGNLTVSGSMTSIDVSTLQVKDNFVKVADGNINVASDGVDFGIYGQANSGGVATYYGIGRVASANAFALFSTTTDIGSTTIGTLALMPLQAYLQPYGNSGAFVVNSSSVTITANSTIGVNLVANTLFLQNALSVSSGGTGQVTYATGDILYASASNALSRLAVGSNGTVMQITNNLPSYGTLDGGTF